MFDVLWNFRSLIEFGQFHSFLEVAFAFNVLTGLWDTLARGATLEWDGKPRLKRVQVVVDSVGKAKEYLNDRLNNTAVFRRGGIRLGRRLGLVWAATIGLTLFLVDAAAVVDPLWIFLLGVVGPGYMLFIVLLDYAVRLFWEGYTYVTHYRMLGSQEVERAREVLPDD